MQVLDTAAAAVVDYIHDDYSLHSFVGYIVVVVAAAAVVVAVVVVVVVVAIHFAPPVMSLLPRPLVLLSLVVLLPRSDSELVLPHSVHPMHLVLLHPQVSVFLETVRYTSDC